MSKSTGVEMMMADKNVVARKEKVPSLECWGSVAHATLAARSLLGERNAHQCRAEARLQRYSCAEDGLLRLQALTANMLG